nr:MAG TPA: hypothetical protein [Caudoviricetes sp.]
MLAELRAHYPEHQQQRGGKKDREDRKTSETTHPHPHPTALPQHHNPQHHNPQRINSEQ